MRTSPSSADAAADQQFVHVGVTVRSESPDSDHESRAPLRARLIRRERLHAERMDLAPHARAERSIDQLMTLDHAPARELGRHDDGFEVRVVVRLHLHLRAGQTGFDQTIELLRRSWRKARRRRGPIVAHLAAPRAAAERARVIIRCHELSLVRPAERRASLLARARRVLETEIAAVAALQSASGRRLRGGLPAAASVQGPRRRHGHGQVRATSAPRSRRRSRAQARLHFSCIRPKRVTATSA